MASSLYSLPSTLYSLLATPYSLLAPYGMRILLLFLLLAGATPAAAQIVVIDNVNVVDVDRGSVRSGLTVTIEGNRIASVARGKPPVPVGAVRIDGSGRYLIPGLWDMHVHAVTPWFGDYFLPLLVANGVTGVRDMFTTGPAVAEWRRKVAAGAIGPRVGTYGVLVDGYPPIWGPQSMVARNPEEGQRIVDSLAGTGGFVKVYSRLDSATFVAIAVESKAKGIPFAGHVPQLVSAAQAADLGQLTVEHLTQVLLGCSSREAEYLGQARSAWASAKKWDSLGVLSRGRLRGLLDSQDDARCRALAARFAKAGTVMVPTITVLRSIAYLDDSTLAADERLKYIPAFLKSGWNPKTDFRFKMLTPDDWKLRKEQHARELAVLRLLHQAGVKMLAGTDLANPYIFPGFSLHDELELLVGIGLTPAEALRSATLEPARFLGATDSLGTVAPGKLADLVLLSANPLADIGNVRSIVTVIANGRVFDGAARRKILDDAAARAARPPGR